MSVFVHAQGITTVHAGGGGGGKKWQNSVHVVVKCPLSTYICVEIPVFESIVQIFNHFNSAYFKTTIRSKFLLLENPIAGLFLI